MRFVLLVSKDSRWPIRLAWQRIGNQYAPYCWWTHYGVTGKTRRWTPGGRRA